MSVTDNLIRCPWVGADSLMLQYHDTEWGVPLRDDQKLFEYLLLDGAQAGLSWRTILRKREGYRRAFHGFCPARVAAYGEADFSRLLADPAIVRNRLKIAAAVGNARAFLEVQREWGTFSEYVWAFVAGLPVVNRWEKAEQVPASAGTSEAMSRDLRRRGFRFVGPTICYAFMQAAGLVNDHLVTCFRYHQVGR